MNLIHARNRDKPRKPRKPLRTFTHGTPNNDSQSKRRLEAYWYFLSPILVILAIASLGVFAVFASQRSSKIKAPPVADYNNYCGDDGSINKEAFLNTYLEAKGLKIGSTETLKFHFRGTYARGNEMVGLTGEADLKGNGLMELAWESDNVKFEFKNSRTETNVDSLLTEDRLAIQSLTSLLSDPILKYALNPKEYDTEMYFLEASNNKIVNVELLHKASGEAFKVHIDAKNLRIKEIAQAGASDNLRLKFYKYESKAGIMLPTRISTTNSEGQVLPVELTDINLDLSQQI